MMQLYYTAPTQEIFDEVKEKAIEVWTEGYPEDTSPFYAQEKVSRIKDLENVQDNVMYMVAMFDINNQHLLSRKLSEEAKEAIRSRMIDGGSPVEFIVF